MHSLRSCFTKFSIFNTVPSPLTLAKFSVIPTRRKQNYNSPKGVIMAIPAHKLFVWQDPDATKATDGQKCLQFALEITTNGLSKKRVYMKRPYDDHFSKMRARLETKLKEFPQSELQIHLLCKKGNSLPCDDDLSLFDLFFGEETKRCEALEISKIKYDVVRDPPFLDRIEIALLPLVGCPVFPSCDWRNNPNGEVKFLWFVADKKLPLNFQISDATTSQRIHLDGWEQVHTGPCYYPGTSDIDKFLAVVVDFGENGIVEGTICSTPIRRADDPATGEDFIFSQRQAKFCEQRLKEDRYRVFSYNILADLYLSLKKTEQRDLFFPYCPKEYQEAKYRYPILLRELEGYKADLMFLQEVDFRMQRRFLVPFLKLKNYTTIFNCKENEVNEGLCIAFDNQRFRPIDNGGNYTIKLSTFLTEDPSNADIMKYLAGKELVSKIVTSRPTIIQLIHLRTKDDLNVLCANTHLYFDPAHEEVKLIQTFLCLRYISAIFTKLADPSARILFAGDLNSDPKSRSVSLILGNEVHLRMGKAKDDESAHDNHTLAIRAPFKSQCLTGFPNYTNFTQADGVNVGFVGCLDYIWAHPPLRIDRIVPMPDHCLVTKYGAIPSKIAPSDHLPIICDISLS